ncbi:hypothetical protein IQ254_07650 [Nodosilinea sp. LEGE 07088]|uniref:tetratricopeptide repeat protein n=1 Tax=Nodosilinea sp. LEGE 07088 TaxID=2777968 RepID=UPI00187F6930|nr:hypothetical protein [Nodosilinea sp. LEGE 07088]MBE9137076.1 hypothetical protein [Nodosilinea sp. LEGE 07088]
MRPIIFLIRWLGFRLNALRKCFSLAFRQVTYLNFSTFDSKFWKYLGLLVLAALLFIQRARILEIGHSLLNFRWHNLVAWSFYAEITSMLLVHLAQALLLFLAVGALLSVMRWLSGRGTGTLVLPFKNVTDDKRYDSPVVADALVAELHRIRHIHSYLGKADPRVEAVVQNIPSIMPSHENLENSLNNIGTIGIGESQIAVGPILMLLQRFWIFGHSGRLITGSIHRYRSTSLEIVARIEDYQVRAWEAVNTVESQADWHKLIREIALKLVIHLEPNLSAESWQAFGKFTDAILEFHRYQQKQDIENLRRAYELCKESLEFQKDYQKLANLLCSIGYAYFRDFRIGKDYLSHAEDIFNKALSLDPGNANAHIGLGNIYVKCHHYYHAEVHYMIAKRKNPYAPYPYNGLGNLHSELYSKFIKIKEPKRAEENYNEAKENYLEAIVRAPRLATPYYNLGLLYYKKYKALRQNYKGNENNRSNDDLIEDSLRKSIRYRENSKELAPLTKENAAIYTALGWIYFILGKEGSDKLKQEHQKSQNVKIKRGINKLKGDYEPKSKEGICYFSAIEEFEEAVAMDSKRFLAYGNMGITYLYIEEEDCINRLDRAKESFSLAVEVLNGILGSNQDGSENKPKHDSPELNSNIFSNLDKPYEVLSNCLYEATLGHINSEQVIFDQLDQYLKNPEGSKYMYPGLINSLLEDVNTIMQSSVIDFDNGQESPLALFKEILESAV